MKVLTIDGPSEIHYDEPLREGGMGPKDDGRLYFGYIEFKNKDCSVQCENHSPEQKMRWPIFFGEAQGLHTPEVFVKYYHAGEQVTEVTEKSE